jgi:hypothetical protein
MARSSSYSQLGSEFDAFLFSPIGEERNGMLLSVLSALARLNVDPWQEAATLALLPGETATQRLATLIAALPDEPSAHRDPGTIAARLIALLPRRAESNTPSRETLRGVGAGINFQTVRWLILVNASFLTFMVVAQWVVISHQAPAPVAVSQQIGRQTQPNQTPSSAESSQPR